jgi:Xaa-Pro aminopeptidase
MIDFPAEEFRERLRQAQRATRESGSDAMVLTPGPNFRYLAGYRAHKSERLHCLVVPAEGDPVLLTPELEAPQARGTPIEQLGVELVSWAETDDALARLVDLLPGGARRIALDDRMWAMHTIGLRRKLPEVEQALAGPIMSPLRMRKRPAELTALGLAAAAIDEVHAHVYEWLRPGRTERWIAREIGFAILTTGHAKVEFVIVASGPNAASPHAEVTDRELERGDPVVVDIGGVMPDGYNSDCTRTYSLGPPPKKFQEYYDVLLEAQEAQCEAAKPGITAARLDAIGRDIITRAGYGPNFMHRTGHGIGLETHEHPYIVADNYTRLTQGMTFSIEPGIYLPGEHGARIEDIVTVTEEGNARLNARPRDLTIID